MAIKTYFKIQAYINDGTITTFEMIADRPEEVLPRSFNKLKEMYKFDAHFYLTEVKIVESMPIVD